MRKDDWPVKEEGIRPVGDPDHCLYCDTRRGGVHKPDCVVRCRTVVVRFSVDLVVAVPEDWDSEEITHKYNEGSICRTNTVYALNDLVGRLEAEEGNGCICEFATGAYLREATAEDEKAQRLFVKNLPS